MILHQRHSNKAFSDIWISMSQGTWLSNIFTSGVSIFKSLSIRGCRQCEPCQWCLVHGDHSLYVIWTRRKNVICNDLRYSFGQLCSWEFAVSTDQLFGEEVDKLLKEIDDLTNHLYLTHWGRDKMAAICQTTSSSAFSWMKMYELRLKFHWILFLRVQLTIFQHWFR